MAEELKACRNCGGQCDPKGWMCGDGRRGPECEGCGITAPDVYSWNRLMGDQLTSQGGEAVEVVARIIESPSAVFPAVELTQSGVRISGTHDLMTVAQHQRILAAATHPADQVADGVVELLRSKFPRIDPCQPVPLDEKAHCCEYTIYVERERLHRLIDAAMLEVKP